jgi:PAS domain S-box-containing protein
MLLSEENVDHNNHLRRMNRMLTGLSCVNQALLRVREDRRRLLREASCIIHEQFLYELVWLGEINRRGEVLYGASAGMLPGESGASAAAVAGPVAQPFSTNSALSALRDVTVRAATENEALVSECISLNHPDCTSLDWSISAIPVPIDPNTTFVLMACAPQGHEFDSEEIDILVEMAGNLGMALETMEIQIRSQSAEQALRISEDRFRRLAESSLVGIVLIQNNLYRYVNPSFAEMFGYESPSEIIDQLGPLDLTAPESQEIVNTNVQKRVLGQIRAARYQYHGLRKDGSVFEVEEHGARTIHAQRLAVVATVLDVTSREASRRRIEALSKAGLALSLAQTPHQALNRAVEQVAAILPCDAATIATFDRESRRPDFLISHPQNTGAVHDMISSGEYLAREDHLQHLLTTQESVAVPRAGARLTSTDTPTYSYAAAPLVVRGELIGLLAVEAEQIGRFSSEDGRHLRLFADHVAATLQHLRLISSLEAERNRLQTGNELSRMLSETLRLQEVAARALRQIGTAIGANVSLLYLWDAPSETFSATAAEGLDPSALVALSAALVSRRTEIARRVAQGIESCSTLSDADQACLRWEHLESIAAKEGIDTSEIACTLELPLEAHGELVGMLSFLTSGEGFSIPDTELAKALGVPVALAIQNAQFYEKAEKQADLMAEALHRQEELDHMKDELIQNVSHELRTPLSLVMGYAEMLRSGELGSLPPQQEAAVGVIARRSRMLSSLVEDITLLWHLERQTAQKEVVDLQKIVTITVAEFQGRAAENGLALSAWTPEEAVLIQAVPLQIRRVLDNLISNSLKFTPAGGSLDVTLEVIDDWAEMAVSDTGIGVAEEKLQRIFERFYQVDGSSRRKYGGTGLGLALVKAIAEMYGGSIYAESPITDDPARPGTRIAIRLPLSGALDEVAHP